MADAQLAAWQKRSMSMPRASPVVTALSPCCEAPSPWAQQVFIWASNQRFHKKMVVTPLLCPKVKSKPCSWNISQLSRQALFGNLRFLIFFLISNEWGHPMSVIGDAQLLLKGDHPNPHTRILHCVCVSKTAAISVTSTLELAAAMISRQVPLATIKNTQVAPRLTKRTFPPRFCGRFSLFSDLRLLLVCSLLKLVCIAFCLLSTPISC